MLSDFGLMLRKTDYEVVKIAYTREKSSVEVYTLSSNSWKTIGETCPGALEISDNNIVYVRGRLHWLAQQERGWIIVSLDMNNAKFREKLASDPCRSSRFYLTRAYEDFLAILRARWISSVDVQDGCTVEVYDEDLMMFSRHLDEERGKNLLPRGFRNNGDALLIQITDGKMLSYDFATKRLKDFGFAGQGPFLTMARPFVKSLVLLNDSDVQITTAPVSQGRNFYR